MAAGAPIAEEDRNLARALARFARALRVNEAAATAYLDEALRHGRQAAGPGQARARAFERLVQMFLADSGMARAGLALEARSGAGAGFGPALRRLAPPASGRDGAWPSRSLDALGGLAPLERAALLLVAVERFSYAEAAQMLGLADADGKSEMAATLGRARAAFAARLAAAPGGRPRLRLVE